MEAPGSGQAQGQQREPVYGKLQLPVLLLPLRQGPAWARVPFLGGPGCHSICPGTASHLPWPEYSEQMAARAFVTSEQD